MTRPSQIEQWPVPFDPAGELDWGDPVLSRRLLREHLDQDHDSASRREPQIRRHLRRLQRLLPAPPARILDAACGPGLYSIPLAQMGYDVVGVDVGPAVLAHAKRSARRSQVAERTRFVRQDLRQLAQPQEFEAAVLVYHILEAFPRPDQRRILRRLRASLVPGGRLIVEMRTRSDHPEGRTSSWYVADSSLLADTPHLLLSDAFTDNRRNTFVLRETAVLDDGSVLAQHTSSAMTTLDRIPGLFDQAGFRVRAIYEGWSAYRADMTSPAVVVVAEAPR